LQNYIGIAVSFAFVFGVIFLAKFMARFGKEASRKTVHILVSNWWLLAMVFFNQPLWAAIVPACFVVLNYLSYRYKIFVVMERTEGKGDLGTVYYALSLLILSLLTFGPGRNPVVGAAGILIMGYGDGLAALIGKRFSIGRYKIFGSTKSMAGNLTMLVVSFAVLMVLLIATGAGASLWLIALGVALVATLVEAATHSAWTT
jgi:phytol kinase